MANVSRSTDALNLCQHSVTTACQLVPGHRQLSPGPKTRARILSWSWVRSRSSGKFHQLANMSLPHHRPKVPNTRCRLGQDIRQPSKAKWVKCAAPTVCLRAARGLRGSPSPTSLCKPTGVRFNSCKRSRRKPEGELRHQAQQSVLYNWLKKASAACLKCTPARPGSTPTAPMSSARSSSATTPSSPGWHVA